MLINEVCLGSGVGGGERGGHGAGRACHTEDTVVPSAHWHAHPSSPHSPAWAWGSHSPHSAASQAGSHHPPDGCQTHPGGRPGRREVIERRKPLREPWVLFTALRQRQRKAFIAERRILFQRYSPGPLQQNNRALVSIYLSCLAHMYFKYI